MVKINRRTFLKNSIAAGISSAAIGWPLSNQCKSDSASIGAVQNHGLLQRSQKKRTNLVLITADTVRAESMSCYGCRSLTSPCADYMAGQGALFTNSYSNSICTLPGHASIFTGLFPDKHGVIDNNRQLPNGIPTLAEILKSNGYDTAAFLGVWILNDPKGLARGFSHLNWQQVNAPGSIDGIRRSGRYMDEVLEYLKTRNKNSSPFFLWVHTFDPHAPFVPPGEFSRMFRGNTSSDFDLLAHMKGNIENLNGYRPSFPADFMLSQYLGEIRYWDSNFQKIFETINESDNLDDTLIVYTSDHGENVGEDNIYGHLDLNQHVIRTPLIMWHPNLIEQKTLCTPVQQTDLTPTILDYLNINTPGIQFEGTSLKSLINGSKPERPNRPAYILDSDCKAAAIIREDLQLKVVKRPVNTPGKLIPFSSKQKNNFREFFTDNIVERDFQWQIKPKGDLLQFHYRGEIKTQRHVAHVELLLVQEQTSGNLRFNIQKFSPINGVFEYELPFARYRKPNPVTQDTPTDFSLHLDKFYCKYAIRLIGPKDDHIYTSPWIFAQITDQNGTACQPTSTICNRIIDLRQHEATEWGQTYRKNLDRHKLMDGLDHFLRRQANMEMTVQHPVMAPYGGLILPGRQEYAEKSPEEVHKIYRQLETGGNQTDESDLNQKLRALGYVE